MFVNIAVDGPAGAGKSTISRGVAGALGFIYVDTGALYRAVGLNAMRRGVDPSDREAVASTLQGTVIELKFVNGEQRVFLNGEDVSEAIRTPEASMAASKVSAIPAVRDFLFDLQRNIAQNNNCLMDGRDIGTVVLPFAQIKLFLTASLEERARRRYNELKEKGMPVEYETVLAEMKERDYNDSHREIAPLKPAADSVLFDNTGLSLEESIKAMTALVKERL